MDAWGHATIVHEANGVTLIRGYDPATGLMTSLSASGPNGTIAQYQYAWDGFGNLTTRTDSTHSAQEISEHETYDKLNRLTKSVLSGGAGTTQTFHYDASGNLTYRSDRGTYSYGAGSAGPHAVTSISDGSTYTYNANGEMTSGAGRSYTWSAFGKAQAITKGSTQVSFAYGPGGARSQKTVTGATSETVVYLGAAERLTVNGHTSIRRTLALADLTIIDTGGANAKLLFPITDHLGSSVVIGSDAGQSTQAMSYGPFGRRMTAGWSAYMSISQALSINENYTDKGYTGQEGLDAVGLWDYNARLYDPALGRFLSVDPLIAHPGSTQAINPYSYVENNPLNKTDPTGMASSGVCNGSNQSLCNTSTKDVQNVTIDPNKGTVTVNQANGTKTTVNVGKAAAGAAAAGAVKMFGSGVVQGGAGAGQGKKATSSGRINNNLHNYNGRASTSAGGTTIPAPPSANGGSAIASTGAPNTGTADVPFLEYAERLKKWAGTLYASVAPVALEHGHGFLETGDYFTKAGEWLQRKSGLFKLASNGALKISGRIFFAGSVILGIREGVTNFGRGGVAKGGLDIGMAAFATFGGPIGWSVGGLYFLIDQTVGWPEALRAQADALQHYQQITGRTMWGTGSKW